MKHFPFWILMGITLGVVQSEEGSKIDDNLFAEIQEFVNPGLLEAKKRTDVLLEQEAAAAHKNPPVRRSSIDKEMTIPAKQQLEFQKLLRERFKLNKRELKEVYSRLERTSRQLQRSPQTTLYIPSYGVCPPPKNGDPSDCDTSYRYRTADGTCNNLLRPLWGSFKRPLRRLLDADYADYVAQPRCDQNGGALPSARLVSWKLFPDVERPSAVHTMLLTFTAQFLDHDLSRTAATTLSTGTGPARQVTCGTSGCQTTGAENRACLPISIPSGDPFFRGRQCIKFVRSEAVVRNDCSFGPREQLNEITAYIDASNVYGSSADEADTLRDWSDPNRGRLRASSPIRPSRKPALPHHTDPECRDVNAKIRCFLSGDARVNENVVLTALHTIFFREHNRIEAQLHRINPSWTGEKLYQESRHIVAAIFQHIVFNEWLPIILGTAGIKKFGLTLKKIGFNDVYDQTANADIANVFNTAAFRFGHSIVSTNVRVTDPHYKIKQQLKLSSVLFRPKELYTGRFNSPGVDNLLRGAITQPSQLVDNVFTKQITQHLFTETPPSGVGMDLPALNIQRGRDHGVPGYNSWREWCGFGRATTFKELFRDIPNLAIRTTLSSLYQNVDDVDVFAAGISEKHMPGAQLGPTFRCIIGFQFRNLMRGDRFWYERGDTTTGFTAAQLQEIRKVTLSKVICDNTDGIKTISPRALLQPLAVATQNLRNRIGESYNLVSLYRGQNNNRRMCLTIPGINLDKWRGT